MLLNLLVLKFQIIKIKNGDKGTIEWFSCMARVSVASVIKETNCRLTDILNSKLGSFYVSPSVKCSGGYSFIKKCLLKWSCFGSLPEAVRKENRGYCFHFWSDKEQILLLLLLWAGIKNTSAKGGRDKKERNCSNKQIALDKKTEEIWFEWMYSSNFLELNPNPWKMPLSRYEDCLR